MKQLRVKNWKQFQHFKDRRPPWIKLYRDILDDREWHRLDGESAKVLVMLWLLASESESGELPSVDEISFRLRMPESAIETAVNNLSHWLQQSDITAISERYHDDLPETETEGETDKETEADTKPDSSRPPQLPAAEILKLYCDLLPMCPRPMSVEKWNQARLKSLRTRWREHPDLDWWQDYFASVAKSKFLTGRCDGTGGRPPFVADIDFLLRPSTVTKLYEGKYHRGAA